MSDQRPKEPKFVPRPCAVCGEPNTVEHRCDYPPSNERLDLAAISALHARASQHHEATDYYSLVLAIRKMLPEIERLTRERDEWKEIADRSSVATSAWIGKHERLRALNEHLDYEVLRWEKESDVLRAAMFAACGALACDHRIAAAEILNKALRPADETPAAHEHEWTDHAYCTLCGVRYDSLPENGEAQR